MQITHSQYADQDVVVAAGFDRFPSKKLFLHVTLRVDYRQEYLESRDIVYSSTDHPELDWTSMQTLLAELERLAVPVTTQFLAGVTKEKATATRHLDILYADDDTELPF